MNEYEDAAPGPLSAEIRNRLSELSNLYSWEVVIYEEFPDIKMEMHSGYRRENVVPPRKTWRVTVPSKGETYFRIPDRGTGGKKRGVAVVWQDAQEKLSCRDSLHAETLVFFKPCDECRLTFLNTSNGMVSSKTCNDQMQRIVDSMGVFWENGVLLSQLPPSVNERVTHEYDFIAAQPNRVSNNLCLHRADACSGHGRCRHIPFTREHMCICDEPYVGENCQDDINTTLTDVIDFLGEMRQNNWNILNQGVPTTVDVYFELMAIPSRLKQASDRIIHEVRRSRCLHLYADHITSAEYIARYYSKVMSNNITDDYFKTLMDRENFEKVVSNVNQYIRGSYHCPYDMLTSFKKTLARDVGTCTEAYSRGVTDMMRYILGIDELISEAWLWYEKVKASPAARSQASLLEKMARIKRESKERQSSYVDLWRGGSCSALEISGSYQRFCGNYSSFIGMTVDITCEDNKQPVVTNVTCRGQNSGSNGVWSSSAACTHIKWGPWGSWSSCSRSCDKGVRTRYRFNTLGGRDTLEQRCNTQDCCQSRYGKHKCGSGKCINATTQVCDGRRDCSDGSDERRDECTYLKSGDTIALRVTFRDHSRFLGCGGRVVGGSGCSPQTCPGHTMSGDKWKTCYEESFVILRADGLPPRAIRYGDTVKLRSTHRSECVSCWGGTKGHGCKLRGCNDRGVRFRIYSVGRERSCSGYTYEYCVGDPLEEGDVIFLQYDRYGYWLSADGSEIKTRGCPRRSLGPDDVTGCDSEAWTVFRL